MTNILSVNRVRYPDATDRKALAKWSIDAFDFSKTNPDPDVTLPRIVYQTGVAAYRFNAQGDLGVSMLVDLARSTAHYVRASEQSFTTAAEEFVRSRLLGMQRKKSLPEFLEALNAVAQELINTIPVVMDTTKTNVVRMDAAVYAKGLTSVAVDTAVADAMVDTESLDVIRKNFSQAIERAATTLG